MVNQGHAAYWIDHRGSIAKVSSGLLKSEGAGFSRQPLYQSGIYAWFQPSERGAQLLETFNREHRTLLESGNYATVFCKNTPRSKNSKGVHNAITYINEKYPELNFPFQKDKDYDFKPVIIGVAVKPLLY